MYHTAEDQYIDRSPTVASSPFQSDSAAFLIRRCAGFHGKLFQSDWNIIVENFGYFSLNLFAERAIWRVDGSKSLLVWVKNIAFGVSFRELIFLGILEKWKVLCLVSLVWEKGCRFDWVCWGLFGIEFGSWIFLLEDVFGNWEYLNIEVIEYCVYNILQNFMKLLCIICYLLKPWSRLSI